MCVWPLADRSLSLSLPGRLLSVSSVVLAKHATELYLYNPKVQPFQQPDAWLQHVVKEDGKAPVRHTLPWTRRR